MSMNFCPHNLHKYVDIHGFYEPVLIGNANDIMIEYIDLQSDS